MKVTKKEMYRIVRDCAGTIVGVNADDYYEPPTSIDSCEFECDEEKATLKFHSAEVCPCYKEFYSGESESLIIAELSLVPIENELNNYGHCVYSEYTLAIHHSSEESEDTVIIKLTSEKLNKIFDRLYRGKKDYIDQYIYEELYYEAKATDEYLKHQECPRSRKEIIKLLIAYYEKSKM